MPGTHVALLRGINVGRAKRVAMADLRALLEDLGYSDVRTLQNSGNAVFTVPRGARGDPAKRIEQGLADELGVSARVTVLQAAELAEIAGKNPLAKLAKDPSRMLVAVLRDPADKKRLTALARQDWSPDSLALGKRAAYLWCSQGILASRLGETFLGGLGDAVTTRNWATVQKLHALCAG